MGDDGKKLTAADIRARQEAQKKAEAEREKQARDERARKHAEAQIAQRDRAVALIKARWEATVVEASNASVEARFVVLAEIYSSELAKAAIEQLRTHINEKTDGFSLEILNLADLNPRAQPLIFQSDKAKLPCLVKGHRARSTELVGYHPREIADLRVSSSNMNTPGHLVLSWG